MNLLTPRLVLPSFRLVHMQPAGKHSHEHAHTRMRTCTHAHAHTHIVQAWLDTAEESRERNVRAMEKAERTYTFAYTHS